MANAAGGVIAYGVEQDDSGRAKALCPFRISGVAERLTLIAQTLDEPLTVSAARTILAEGSEDKGFLVVEIPTSDRAPHFFRGTAWGRTPKGNVPLTRRQIGDLFARQAGFAQEFGLVVGRPGRLFVRSVTESHQTGALGRLMTNWRYYLLFENDGDTDILDADWEWLTPNAAEAALPDVFQNPFPLNLLQPRAQVRVQLSPALNTAANPKLTTHWRDAAGKHHEQMWPITW